MLPPLIGLRNRFEYRFPSTRTCPRSADIPDCRCSPADRRKNARQSWIRKLIDLSRRNNLLYFRPLKRGTLDLTSAPSERLHDLLMGQSVAVAKLAPDLEDEALTKIVRDKFRLALQNSEEKGLSTLFVTFGMATWPSLDGDRPAESPVLLLPVAISKKEGSNSYYLASTGNFQLNLVLLTLAPFLRSMDRRGPGNSSSNLPHCTKGGGRFQLDHVYHDHPLFRELIKSLVLTSTTTQSLQPAQVSESLAHSPDFDSRRAL